MLARTGATRGHPVLDTRPGAVSRQGPASAYAGCGGGVARPTGDGARLASGHHGQARSGSRSGRFGPRRFAQAVPGAGGRKARSTASGSRSMTCDAYSDAKRPALPGQGGHLVMGRAIRADGMDSSFPSLNPTEMARDRQAAARHGAARFGPHRQWRVALVVPAEPIAWRRARVQSRTARLISVSAILVSSRICSSEVAMSEGAAGMLASLAT